MKKYILLFSVVIQVNYAMELSETRSLAVNATSKEDYQCYWVARYLNKCWHKLDNSEKKQVDNFYQQSPLADQVMSYQNSMKESDEEAEDFLQKVWDKTIYDAYQMYCQLQPAVRYQVAFSVRKSPMALLLNQGRGIVCLDTVQDITMSSCGDKLSPGKIITYEYDQFLPIVGNGFGKIEEKDIEKNEQIETLLRTWTICQLCQLSIMCRFTLKFKMWGFFKSRDNQNFIDLAYPIDYKINITPGIRFSVMLSHYQKLLKKLCEGSTAYKSSQYIDDKYLLTKIEQYQLKSIHDKVKDLEEWKELQKARIGIAFQRPSIMRRLIDRMLLAIPLCLVDVVIPQLIYNATASKLTTGLGFLPCAIASLFVGSYFFPVLDSCNSGVGQLRDVFGKQGVRKIYRGRAFCCYGLLHYMATIISSYCFSFANNIGYCIGMTIQVLRLSLLLGGIMSTKHKNDDYNAFGKIAFAHPGLRRNAQDQPFTLGDLVNKEIPAV